MATQKAAPPRFACRGCGHSSQWHQQSEATMKAGATSFHGAPCFAPDCTCRNYAPKPIERAR